MTRLRLATLAVVLAGAIGTVLLTTQGKSRASIAAGDGSVQILAQNGFGSRNNSYAWSMDWFKGELYVGTGRDELCTEKETTQFYYPFAHQYVTEPSPNVRCASNPYKLPLQAQIWRFDPKTGRWQYVYQSPLIKNPLAKHMMVSRDMAYRGMTVFKNPQGQSALFAAAVTPDEYLPPLQKSHPPVLLRTYDGVHWTVMHLPETTVHYPFGNHHPMGFRSLVSFRGKLYVTATPSLTGDGGLFQVVNPFSAHPYLRQVSNSTQDIFEVEKFDGKLYIGTGSDKTGYSVQRTSGLGRAPYHWTKIVTDGAGRGNRVTSVVSMHVYRNRLYVGSSGWYVKDTIPISEMVRIAPDGTWTLVAGNPRTLKSGRTVNPVSGLYDGFFVPFNAHFWRMTTQGGGLYVGTNDWIYAIQEDKSYAWLDTVFSGSLGFDMWATCNGNEWFEATPDAFTGNQYNFGGRNLIGHGDNLYIGTANQSQGTTIFDDKQEACGSLVKGPGISHPPSELMIDQAKVGRLLSWQPSQGATSYEIKRASFTNARIGIRKPQTVPSGVQFDDSVPSVTRVGAPDSETVTLSFPGSFQDVATTNKPYWIDRTKGRYVYEIVAKNRSGAISQASNIEVSSAAGAPTTFAGLQSSLTPLTSDARAADAIEADPETTIIRELLARAQRLASAGHFTAARRIVARVQAAAGQNDELAAGAAALIRRLQYARLLATR